MDLGLLIATAAASVAAVVSAIVAVVQARGASASKRDAADARDESRKARDESALLAKEANDAFLRQAVAQEKHNELKEAELRPPTWSGPRFVSGQRYAVTNTSGRTIKIERLKVDPDEAKNLVSLISQPNDVYPPGHSVDYIAEKRLAHRPQSFTLYWRFKDEPEAELTELVVPL
jgi:hypothetical protein